MNANQMAQLLGVTPFEAGLVMQYLQEQHGANFNDGSRANIERLAPLAMECAEEVRNSPEGQELRELHEEREQQAYLH